MKLDQEHLFKSKYHNIKLVATEFDEPHPGHMIWRYAFYINDELIENQWINYKWGGLYPNLAGYTMESDNGKYIYLPIEGNTLLYECSSESFKSIPNGLEARNNNFVKNVFSEGRLIIVMERGLQVIELNSLTSQNVQFDLGRYKLLEAQYIDDLLIVKYKDLSDYQVYNKKYDFNEMDFEN